MHKVWLASYPPGVPPEIDVHEYDSLIGLLEQSFKRYWDRPAFSNLGAVLTFADLDRLSLAFAAFLQQQLKLNKGERVAVMLPNILQYPIAALGVLRAGLVVVNTNPLYTPRELKHQLQDSGAKVIVVLENFAHVVEQTLPETAVQYVITTRLGDLLGFPKSMAVNFAVKYIKKMVPPFNLAAITWSDALKAGVRLKLIPETLTHTDLAFLQYTGGTTGIAKGAMLSHGNLVANILQCRAWFKPWLRTGEEVIITALPLYHIFALTINCWLSLHIGGLSHLITNPRDMPGFIKELKQVKFSVFIGVNTLFNALLNAPGFAELDFSKMRLALAGGMALQPTVAARWKQVTGNTIIEGYGLTETSPVTHGNPLNIEDYTGAIGVALPSTDCAILDDAGNPLGLNQPGELCVKGPQVMQGYWNQPAETEEVLSQDGWFRTGDIATMDDKGFVRIVDRKKDMILVSGFNVYPNEIEGVVVSHPGVLEAAVVGVPDEQHGEVVKLFVVKKDPGLTTKMLLEFCRTQLTGYKIPKHIEFRDELPKTNVGKILRRALRT